MTSILKSFVSYFKSNEELTLYCPVILPVNQVPPTPSTGSSDSILVPPSNALDLVPSNENKLEEEAALRFDIVPTSLPDKINLSGSLPKTLADIGRLCNVELLLIASLKLFTELPVVDPDSTNI